MDSSKAEHFAKLMVKVAAEATAVANKHEDLPALDRYFRLLKDVKEVLEKAVINRDVTAMVIITDSNYKPRTIHLGIKWRIDEQRSIEHLFSVGRYEPKSKVESMITTLKNWKSDLRERSDGIEDTNPLTFTIDYHDKPYVKVMYRDLQNRKVETSDSFFSKTRFEGVLELLKESLKYLPA